MPDVTADIKTRYSIYVPKPLARINFGDWQKRDGANFSPKFGYPGVSVQTDQSLFVDVVKTTYMQMRGSFVAHASDWLQCSLKPMVLATTDNATLGVDGTATLVAGAGQAPTWTMDHGDGIETVPYINLQLHYRVEEVQNSIFEFFRGRREKKDPFRLMDFGASKLSIIPELFKKEVEFDSSGVGKEEITEWDSAAKSWKKPHVDLAGGFELLAERSWQELYGKSKWDYSSLEDDPKNAGKKLLKKYAPHDIFGGLKDVRLDPDTESKLHNDVQGNTGARTRPLLKYGFSASFSRFDPYLLIDPEAIKNDPKYADRPIMRGILVFLAYMNNFVVDLKRRVDVMYKMSTFLRDNALIKVVKDAAAAVDGVAQAIKAWRGNAELLWQMGRMAHNGQTERGWWGEQMSDEVLSGLYKRGMLWDKLANDPAAKTLAQAVVRSMAPYKDPTAKSTDTTATKGFYGGEQKFGGGYRLPGGTQLLDNDRVRIRAKDKSGNVKEFDTPPIRINTALAAELTGNSASSSGKWKPGAKLLLQIDSGAWSSVDITTPSPGRPTIASAALPAGLFVTSTGLYNKTLTVSTDGGAPVSVTFNETNAANEAALLQTLTSTFNTANPTISSAHVLSIASRNTSTGTVVVSGDAAAALGLAAGPAQSIASNAPLAASLFAESAGLVGKTFTFSPDGGTDVSVTFTVSDVKDVTAFGAKLTAALADTDVSVAGNVLTLTSKYCGPGASVEVKSSGNAVGASLINISTTKVSGASVATVLTHVQTTLGSANVEIIGDKLKLKSTLKGALSKVQLAEGGSDVLKHLGLTATSATGMASKKPEELTAEDIVAIWNTSPEAKDVVTFAAEDGQVVITSAYKGDGSFVEVSTPQATPNNGANMVTALQFLGDFRGEKDRDEIRELTQAQRDLDDFDKANTELQKLPDDLAVVFRPITIIGKNAVGAVSKAANIFKGVFKIAGIKLPTPKGSIGLIANKGISLGTPDRIVGAGGQGIIFIADGGAGLPDHAKYVLFEDTFNKIAGADLFGQVEPPKDKPSSGFRAFSDTTADLVARNTAHLLALGRTKQGAEVVGSGVARVGGSYAVELAGQEKVVIGARDKKIGRVEVLGTTVALGYTQVDIDDQPFGLVKRGATAGWPNEAKAPNKLELAKEHAQTSSVLIHSTEQACVAVGPYMLQVRSKKGQEEAALVTKARVQAAQDRVDQATQDVDDLNDVLILFMDDQELQDHNKLLDAANNALQEAQTELANAQAADGLANSIIGEGVFITMREPDAKKNTAITNIPHKGKPAIYMNSDGVTVTMKYGEDDGDDTARITLTDAKVEVRLGQKAGLLITKTNVRLQDGNGNMARFEGDEFKVIAGRQITFGKASKIMLG